jgi:hypothetical protein
MLRAEEETHMFKIDDETHMLKTKEETTSNKKPGRNKLVQ